MNKKVIHIKETPFIRISSTNLINSIRRRMKICIAFIVLCFERDKRVVYSFRKEVKVDNVKLVATQTITRSIVNMVTLY